VKARLIHISIYILLFVGCATITNPNGGPKDVRPPRLESSIPANKQTNYKGKTVELTFNEPVKLNNAKDEIIISPSAGKEVEFKVKKNQVFITPKDGWRDSTTYSILFREGVKDVTEGNVPVNLKLAFSTGNMIDSLSIIGKVTELLKGSALDKMTVAIYQQDTFDIFTDVPAYFTKTDKRGRFSLDNIKNGNYKIYAFDDKNKNLKVESRTEKFGFLAGDLELQKNTDSLRLPLIMLDMRMPKILSIRNIGAITKLRFNKFITSYKFQGDTSNITFAYGDNQTEMNFWVSSQIGDSIKLQLTARDSIENVVDSVFYIKQTNTKTIKDAFKWSLGQPIVNSETGKFETIISFNKPIVTLTFDSLYIKKDTTEIIKITKEDISLDLRRKQFTVTKELDRKFFKEEKDPIFSLKAGKGFIQSIDNDTTKALTTPIPILWPEDTGVLLIEVATTEENYLIQLMQDEKILRTIKNVTKYAFKSLPASLYRIRIIVDRNGNGNWDPGNIRKGKEPERVIFYTGSDKKQTFPIRANWELGPLILRF
jgi:uncharacterized protein (DUF2141 family)